MFNPVYSRVVRLAFWGSCVESYSCQKAHQYCYMRLRRVRHSHVVLIKIRLTSLWLCDSFIHKIVAHCLACSCKVLPTCRHVTRCWPITLRLSYAVCNIYEYEIMQIQCETTKQRACSTNWKLMDDDAVNNVVWKLDAFYCMDLLSSSYWQAYRCLGKINTAFSTCGFFGFILPTCQQDDGYINGLLQSIPTNGHWFSALGIQSRPIGNKNSAAKRNTRIRTRRYQRQFKHCQTETRKRYKDGITVIIFTRSTSANESKLLSKMSQTQRHHQLECCKIKQSSRWSFVIDYRLSINKRSVDAAHTSILLFNSMRGRERYPLGVNYYECMSV